MAAALAVFETAVTQALRCAGRMPDLGVNVNVGAQTAWQTFQPDEIADPRKRK